LVYCYEDGEGNGNGNGNCLREKGVGQGGGEGEWKDGFVHISCFHFDVKNCCGKNGQRRRGGRRRMWFEFTIGAFYFLD
jgi:hypothetical protein